MSKSILVKVTVILVTALLAGTTVLAQRRGGARDSARTSVNRTSNRNTTVNTRSTRNTNVEVNRNVRRDVDIDVDVNRRYGYGCCYHPVATTAAVVATAAVVGSVVYTLPPSCTVVMVNGFAYQQCGSTWYQPRYAGTSVTYVVVNRP